MRFLSCRGGVLHLRYTGAYVSDCDGSLHPGRGGFLEFITWVRLRHTSVRKPGRFSSGNTPWRFFSGVRFPHTPSHYVVSGIDLGLHCFTDSVFS